MDIGPTLPKYIVKIIIIFPTLLSVPVRPRESPTVAVALTVSYRISSAGASVTAESQQGGYKYYREGHYGNGNRLVNRLL